MKYLGFTFCNPNKDDEDILRQMRSGYARSNRLRRMLCHCSSIDVTKVWTDYKKTSFSNIRVAFNNAYRRIRNFEAMLRKSIYNFIQLFEACTNSVAQVLMQSWYTNL